MTQIPHLEEAIAELRKLHPDGSFSVHWTHLHGPHAHVHANGRAFVGSADTYSEAFHAALSQVPQRGEAIRLRVERARAELRAAEDAAIALLGAKV